MTFKSDNNLRQQALDPTKSFIVQAPAGSGKTTLLIKRLLVLLANLQKAPEECLAITFTKKAAAEMKSRVIFALENASNDPLAQKVIYNSNKLGWNLLLNPNRIKIQTIDSFCASIAAKAPLLAKFGIKPEIAENSEELYIQAVRSFLDHNYTEPKIREALDSIFLYLDNDKRKIANLFIEMLPVREKWLRYLFSASDFTVLELGLNTEIFELIGNIHTKLPDNIDLIINLLKYSEINIGNNTDTLDTLDNLDSIVLWHKLSDLLLTKKGDLRKTVTKKNGFPITKDLSSKTNKQLMLEILKELQDKSKFIKCLYQLSIIPANYQTKQKDILEKIIYVLPHLISHLKLVFLQIGKVDFSEVTMNAINALGNVLDPSDLALSLDYKLKHILIDEFQDTSKTQFDLLTTLTRGWQPDDGRTLFLVGDPMQSIYKFRQAEVGLFLAAKKYGVGDIKLNFLQLTNNFRSTSKIVDWINQEMVEKFPKEDDLSKGAISYSKSYSNIKNVDSKIEYYSDNQTENIIKIIKDLYKKNQNNKISIAILVKSRGHLESILPSLIDENINYIGTDLTLLNKKEIIRDLLSLTNAILYLGDRISWLAILRSPYCGLCLQDLQNLIPENDIDLLWPKIEDYKNNNLLSQSAKKKLDHIVPILDYSIKKIGVLQLGELIANAWDKLGGNLCVKSDQDLLDLHSFFKTLRKLESTADIYTFGFLEERLSKIYSNSDLVDIVDKNVVQIMTIHKSKGLEFDAVILPSVNKKSRSDLSKLLLWEEKITSKAESYLLAAPIKSAYENEDNIYKYISTTDKEKQEYENQRLLYVGLTRAKKYLYLLEDRITENSSETNLEKSNILYKIKDQYIPEFKSNMVLFNLEDGSMNEMNDFNPLKDWMRHVGTVVHRELWKIATHGSLAIDHETLTLMKKRWFIDLNNLGVGTNKLLEAVDLVAQAIYNTINCEHGRWILDHTHKESKAEWALTSYKNGELVHVVIDRSFVVEDGTRWVIDYKTCITSDPIKELDSYKSQLKKYSDLIKSYCDQPSIKMGLYFPLQGKWLKL